MTLHMCDLCAQERWEILRWGRCGWGSLLWGIRGPPGLCPSLCCFRQMLSHSLWVTECDSKESPSAGCHSRVATALLPRLEVNLPSLGLKCWLLFSIIWWIHSCHKASQDYLQHSSFIIPKIGSLHFGCYRGGMSSSGKMESCTLRSNTSTSIARLHTHLFQWCSNKKAAVLLLSFFDCKQF